MPGSVHHAVARARVRRTHDEQMVRRDCGDAVPNGQSAEIAGFPQLVAVKTSTTIRRRENRGEHT
jgi:hypothetical protein